jgi:predicted transcriptional regulator
MLKRMEVHLTPEQEMHLAQIASHSGKDVAELLHDAALHLLEEDEHFHAQVREGTEQAERGEFIEEEEMDIRIKRMFLS